MGSIFILLAIVVSEKCEVAQNSETIWTYSCSRSSKVIDLGASRKCMCDFLLVCHSNLGHCFRDMGTYWLKVAYFSHHSRIWHPHSQCSLWILQWSWPWGNYYRVMELLCGESYTILTSTVFDWSTRVTDGQTDGRAIVYSVLYSIQCCHVLKTSNRMRELLLELRACVTVYTIKQT